MTKERVHVMAEEELMKQFRAIAERQRWSYTTATEIAIELFVAKYGQLELFPQPALAEQEKVA